MDEQVPKIRAVPRTTEQEMAEDEVRRAARELLTYFKGRRSHREALAALKTIKRFVRAQQKQHGTTTIALRADHSLKKAKKSGAS